MFHARLTYRITLTIGTLLVLSACGGGNATHSEVEALRLEVAELKQAQTRLKATLAALQKAAAPGTADQVATTADGDPAREAVHRIPTDFSPRKGGPIAAVTVVEFADFQCPFCQAAAGLPDELMKEFPNDVQFVFKNYPLGRHAQAMDAARAGWAAGKQDKFWEMHDLIYAGNIQQLTVEVLRGYAQKLGLDMEQFDADMSSPKSVQAVGFDKILGKGMKVSGTPTYFVNGRRVTDRSPGAVRAKVASEIAKLKQSPQP